MLGDLVVGFGADTRRFIQATGEVRQVARDTAREIGEVARSIAKSFVLPRELGALSGSITSGAAIGQGIREAVAVAGQHARAEKLLAMEVAATGEAAGLTAREITQYADALQNTTSFSRTATLGAAGLLTAFREVKGDVFKEALQAAQDLATMTGGDLQESIAAVGRALNDPSHGLKGIGKYFTEAEREQLKFLATNGEIAAAQRAILDRMHTGLAVDMASPVEQAKNAMSDLVAMIGQGALPYVKAWAKEQKEVTSAIAHSAQAAETIKSVWGLVADSVQVVKIQGMLFWRDFTALAYGAYDLMARLGIVSADALFYAKQNYEQAQAAADKADSEPWAHEQVDAAKETKGHVLGIRDAAYDMADGMREAAQAQKDLAREAEAAAKQFEKERDQLMKHGKAMIERNETPVERATRERSDVNRLWSVGALGEIGAGKQGDLQRNREFRRIQKELETPMREAATHVGTPQEQWMKKTEMDWRKRLKEIDKMELSPQLRAGVIRGEAGNLARGMPENQPGGMFAGGAVAMGTGEAWSQILSVMNAGSAEKDRATMIDKLQAIADRLQEIAGNQGEDFSP